MPFNVGNIIQVGMLGSKVIKGVLLDETLGQYIEFVWDLYIMESIWE